MADSTAASPFSASLATPQWRCAGAYACAFAELGRRDAASGMSARSPTGHEPLVHQAKTGRPSVGHCSPTITQQLFSLGVRLGLGGNEAIHQSAQHAGVALPLHHHHNTGEHIKQSGDP